MNLTCPVCPHHCTLTEGASGLCKARINKQGQIVAANYGKVTALALDPIEKKPLKHFHAGSKILSVGSYGCNLSCPFCQNYQISMFENSQAEFMAAEQLVQLAKECVSQGNIGLAYTYNEPLVGYEYVKDCAKLAQGQGLKNVVVTNGSVKKQVLEEIAPWIDAFNVDLKAFTEGFYQKIGGDLATVKEFIYGAASRSHVEVTTLIIPGENDSLAEMERLSSWLAQVSDTIPLHITRFFPRWQMLDREPTSIEQLDLLAACAKKKLQHVYLGNV